MRTIHRILLLAAAAAGLGHAATAQNMKLNLFGGYTFQDKFNTSGTSSYYGSYSNARVADAPHFGGSLEFEIRRNKCIELLYQNQPTEGYINGTFKEYGPYNVNINYIMLGGLGYKPFSDAVSGYGGINLGCAFMTGDANATKFAVGGKLGIMINATPTVGIKLGAQVLSAVQGVGGGFYFGTGGASAGVSTYSSIYQFGFTGGLCFTLNGRSGGTRPTGNTPPPPPPSHP